jgi:hypothetical protein
MYQVNIDGGRVYFDGRLANVVIAALEHFIACDDAGKYVGDTIAADRAITKLMRRYDNMEEEVKDVDFSGGWGEL